MLGNYSRKHKTILPFTAMCNIYGKKKMELKGHTVQEIVANTNGET